MRRQRTIKRPVAVRGYSFISGHDVILRFCPAPENSGLHFVRTDLSPPVVIPADMANRLECPRRTVLACEDVRVEMTEHVLAALRGLGIDNCRIEINAPETPGCDGSSLYFARALLDAGARVQTAWCEPLGVEHPVCVSDGAAFVAALPNPHGYLELDYTLDYRDTSPVIGRQRFACQLNLINFLAELAPARTFLLEHEAEQLRTLGWGQRTSPRDLLIFGERGPIGNAQRYHDEPARHKALDIVGDLALLGTELVGTVVAFRSGHRLNGALARALRRYHGLDVPLSIGAGVPIWPGILSEVPVQGSGPRQREFVLSERAVRDEPIARGALVLAAWITAARMIGCSEQLDFVEFEGIAVEAVPQPGRRFTAWTSAGGATTQVDLLQDGLSLGSVRIRPASAVARAA